MTKRRIWPNHYFFWRSNVTSFGDSRATQQFLSPFKGDPAGMNDLRSLLLQSRRVDLSHLTDDQVVSEVSRLIVSGELVVAMDRRWDSGGSTGNAAAPSTAPPPPAPALSSGGRSAEPESSTFPPDHSGATQAATLAAAAATGAPFCAQCAKEGAGA